MKKKALVLALALAMVVSLLAACGGSNPAPAGSGSSAPSGEKELKVQVGPNPETLDPALNSAVDGANTILHAFEGLLVVDQNGELAPGQAESWEPSEDGLEWTFHLRDGLKWSD
ncbi:MAG: ABC transporter substrate-binding protein, partial [Lachnospiraceae bacterium]|nr:ABC transporter substrate-binding protein [Lachnospiraceae bacterium]